MRAVAVVILAIAAGEILCRDHAVAECRVGRVDPRVDHGDADSSAGEPRQAAFARPYLVCADRFGGHVCGCMDAHIAREVVDCIVTL